jgi:hypothetical protein
MSRILGDEQVIGDLWGLDNLIIFPTRPPLCTTTAGSDPPNQSSARAGSDPDNAGGFGGQAPSPSP